MSNDENETNAWQEIQEKLRDDEEILAGTFDRSWGYDPNQDFKSSYGDLLSPDEMKSYLTRFSWNGGFGSPDCPAAVIWTNQRIFFPSQYDGATSLHSIPIEPEEGVAIMPGGG